MSDVTISPNMSMPVPNVGIDLGPDWANNINACLSIIDSHNHSLGTGNQVTPAGLDINSDLTMNLNNLTNVRTVRFTPQSSALSLPSDLGCIYEVGVDLYYNDGSGNQIRITQSGSVAGASGTITGLPSGTASASYLAGTFVFQSATNTPANIDGGSFIFRDDVANSHGVTISPVNSLAVDYSLILPLLPSVTSIMTLDAAGNIAASLTVDNSSIIINSGVIEVGPGGIVDSMIATGTITPDKAAPSFYGLSLNPTLVSFTTAGSTSWSVPATVSRIFIVAVGGGGGGGGGGTSVGGASTAGITGGNTTFNGNIIAMGGIGGGGNVNGAGGLVSIGPNYADFYFGGAGAVGSPPTNGSSGAPSQYFVGGAGGPLNTASGGGGGGASSLAVGGLGGNGNGTNGSAGTLGSGGGGGGATSGGGGGAGGNGGKSSITILAVTPSASIPLVVGAGGAGGGGVQTSGGAGGDGALYIYY